MKKYAIGVDIGGTKCAVVLGKGSVADYGTLSVYMYKQAFGAFQVGYGMAIALILLFIGALLSLGYMRLIKANQD